MPTAAVGSGLIAEHPALRVAGEVDVTTGVVVHVIDDLVEGDDVIGEGAVPPAFLPVRGTEVDHPGVEAHRVQDADRSRLTGDVVHVRRHHHRGNHHHRSTGLGGVGFRIVMPQPVHAGPLDDLERGRGRPRFQAAVTDHLEAVLRGRHHTSQGPHHRSTAQCHEPLPIRRVLRVSTLSGMTACHITSTRWPRSPSRPVSRAPSPAARGRRHGHRRAVHRPARPRCRRGRCARRSSPPR